MSTLSKQKSDTPVEILLVEDNPGDIRLLQEAFDATSTETDLQTITHGDDAIEFLTRQATEEPSSLPDLVFVDLGLPGRHGCEVLEAIRENSQLKRLPVIILTSSDANEDIARCYDALANAYLTKPSDLEGFISLAEMIEVFWFDQVQLPTVS